MTGILCRVVEILESPHAKYWENGGTVVIHMPQSSEIGV